MDFRRYRFIFAYIFHVVMCLKVFVKMAKRLCIDEDTSDRTPQESSKISGIADVRLSLSPLVPLPPAFTRSLKRMHGELW